MMRQITNEHLEKFGKYHYTYINQIFGDVTVREIIAEIFPNKKYSFRVEEAGEGFEQNTDHHILFDEIYFGVNAPTPTPPSTALSHISGNPYVHVIQGLAKTIGFAGFKIGWITTHNPTVSESLYTRQSVNCASLTTQHYLSTLFESTEDVWHDIFDPIYTQRLALYHHFTTGLRERSIPFIDNHAEAIF